MTTELIHFNGVNGATGGELLGKVGRQPFAHA
jgi:hypothetical protein